jgi:hypothetical protein
MAVVQLATLASLALLGAEPESSPTRFDIDNLLADEDVRGGSDITVAQVQALLTQKSSFLASYTDPAFNLSASELIVGQSIAEGISPLYMLARIQAESSLVESRVSAHLEAATGCGCPDGGGCTQSDSGFGKQVACAAKLMHDYFAELDAGMATVAGWRVGQPKSTSDPCSVTPANKATAALYTYTPWVGAYGQGCGRSDVGGSSLVALEFAKYQSLMAWGGTSSSPDGGQPAATSPVGIGAAEHEAAQPDDAGAMGCSLGPSRAIDRQAIAFLLLVAGVMLVRRRRPSA